MKTLIFISTLLVAVFFSCKKNDTCVDGYANPIAYYCGDTPNPVCGCDNVTYNNKCDAINADLVSWTDGKCN